MKKIYFLLMALLVTAMIARSQKKWIGAATGGNWATGTNWTGNTVPGPADNVVLDGGISGTITNVANVTVRTLIITDNSNVTLDYSGVAPVRKLTISNTNGNGPVDLTVAQGSRLVISGANFTGITLTSSAKASIAGTLAINEGRTFETDDGSSNTNVTSTGVIENNGTIITGNSNNRLSFEGGATYIHLQNGGTVPLADWNANSNCIISGVESTVPILTSLEQEFGNFEWNCPLQTANLSFAGRLGEGNLQNKIIRGDLIVKNTGTGAVYLALTADYSLTVEGDYEQTGGTLVLNQERGNGNLAIEGNFNMSGGVLAKNSLIDESTITFGGNAAHTFTKIGGIISGSLDFVISDKDTINFGTSILSGSTSTFTLQSGAKIITSDPAGLNSAGAFGPIQTATRVFSTTADYEFRGAVTGIFNTGASTNTTASEVRNLIINNPSGSVTLSKPVTIANNTGTVEKLYLQNGALITTAVNILTLEDNVQATGTTGKHQYNLNSFVEGPLKKIGNDDFIFPVGKVGFGLHKIGISDPIGGSLATTAFTAQFFRGDPHTRSNTLGAGLVKLSACEYWTLDRSAGSTTQVQVMLSWENNSSCGGSQYVTLPASLTVARLDATGSWLNAGNTNTTGITPFTTGTVTSTTINAFSPFALASTSAANPLPVVFGDVKAYENNNGVQIEWSNLTEKDVAEYTIERSANGSDFNGIGSQLPTSNQNDKASYSAFDATPAQGINYYRIKAEETTGKIVYSKILSVSLGKSSYGLRLYPNPVTGNQVTISLSNMKRGQYNLRVVNATGQDVFKKIILNQSNSLTQTLDLPSSIKPGVYNMVITTDGYRETKMFIVQ